MKTKSIIYWIATTLIACDATLAGVLYLTQVPFVMKAFAHMGYPTYFTNILGVAQLLGACAILVPRNATVKEWAYAGFGITYIVGFVSHVISHDGPEALEPLVVLAVLTVSYLTRPAGRGGPAQPSNPLQSDGRVGRSASGNPETTTRGNALKF